MMILSLFLTALAGMLDAVLAILFWIIIIRAVVTWVNPDPGNPIVRFLSSVCDPLLFAIQQRVSLRFSGVDFTPLLVLLAIQFIGRVFLVGILRYYALVLHSGASVALG